MDIDLTEVIMPTGGRSFVTVSDKDVIDYDRNLYPKRGYVCIFKLKVVDGITKSKYYSKFDVDSNGEYRINGEMCSLVYSNMYFICKGLALEFLARPLTKFEKITLKYNKTLMTI